MPSIFHNQFRYIIILYTSTDQAITRKGSRRLRSSTCLYSLKSLSLICLSDYREYRHVLERSRLEPYLVIA
eukprot:jgi/Botrbrau1/6965/Bobra.0165s0004.1